MNYLSWALGALFIVVGMAPRAVSAAQAPEDVPSSTLRLLSQEDDPAWALESLRRHGVAVLRGRPHGTLEEAYRSIPWANVGIFVTADAVLSLWADVDRRVTERARIAAPPHAGAAVAELLRAAAGVRGRVRHIPSGDELAAALGSPAARERILATGPAGARALAACERWRAGSERDEWIEALSALFAVDPRAPQFMRGAAWQGKQADACLAAWAQRRHGKLRYRYALWSTAGAPESRGVPLAAGYVEPLPALYRALAGLAERRRSLTASAGRLPADAAACLETFAAGCRELAAAAEAELAHRLTVEQSGRVAAFGGWLRHFSFASDPVLAEVGTAEGLVLQIGTGAFRSLLVQPDGPGGKVYLGWVRPCCVIAGPKSERLEPARWESALAASRHGDCPSWMLALLPPEEQEAVRVERPLLDAERLAIGGQAEAALARLRSVVAQGPDTLTAAQAQLQIGEILLRRGDTAQARVELGRCLTMRAGEAQARARELLEQAPPSSREWEEEQAAQFRQWAQQARDTLAALKNPALAPARRLPLERTLAGLYLGRGPFLPPGQSDPLADRSAVLATCRTPYIRERIEYAALPTPYASSEGSRVPPEAIIDACLVFARRCRSVPLRAAALSLAVQAGLYQDAPAKAWAVLRPYAAKLPFTPARFPEAGMAGPPRDPGDAPGLQEVYLATVAGLRRRLIVHSYHAGRPQEMLAWYRDLPAEESHAFPDQAADLAFLAVAFPDHALRPLAQFGQAEALAEEGRWARAAGRYLEIARRFPKARIAPYALLRAVFAFRRAGDDRLAVDARALLVKRHPQSHAGVLARTEIACEQNHVRELIRLSGSSWDRVMKEAQAVARSPREAKQPPVTGVQLYACLTRALDEPGYREIEAAASGIERIWGVLAPVVRAAGKPELLDRIGVGWDAARAVEELARALPERADQLSFAVLCAERPPYGCEQVAVRFLQRAPDHERAQGAWQMLGRLPLDETLLWLAPLLDRPGEYRYFDEALTCLQSALESRNLGVVERNVRRVQAAYTGTRVARAAVLAFARVLIARGRTEEALPHLESLAAATPADRVAREAQKLRGGIALSARARRRPPWTPAWVYHAPGTGGPLGEDSLYYPGRLRLASPLLLNGLLIVPAAETPAREGLVALDAETGARKWWAPVGRVISLANDGEGRLFCGTHNSSIVSLDAATGKVLYEHVFDPNRCWPAQVAVAGKVLIATCDNDVVLALAAATGEVLWRKEWAPLSGRPAIAGGSLVVAAIDGRLRALDPGTGEVRWEKAYRGSEGRPSFGGQPVALPDGRLLVRSLPPELVDAAEGRVCKTFADPASAWLLSGEIALGPGHLVAGGENGSASPFLLPGLEGRSWPGGQSLEIAGAAIHGGLLYAPGSTVRAVELESGVTLASTDNLSALSVTATDRFVYVLCRSGDVLAFPPCLAPPGD